MKTTRHRPAVVGGHDCGLRPRTNSRAREQGSNNRPSRVRIGIRPAVGAVALLAVLGTLPPGAQAVTCNPMERGTLSAGNVFVAGATGNDYRIVCTSDGTSPEVVTPDDLDAAIEHADADPWGDNVDRIILQLSNAYLDWGDDDEDGGNVVFLGIVQGAAGVHGIKFRVWDELAFWEDLNIDSHATVRTTGGGQGISVSVGDDNHSGTVRVRNHGSVTTSGGGASDGNRRGRGVYVTSHGGDAEAINESGGSVVTRGPGAFGVGAGTNGGTATAINRGTITTQGHGFLRRGSLQESDGLRTWADGKGVMARSTNEASGTIQTSGTGARGINATAEGGPGIAVSTNRGTVTTTGGVLQSGSDYQQAHGMNSWSEFGSAYSINQVDATVTTSGTGARGVQAGIRHGGPNEIAYALNHGTVKTTGGGFDDDTYVTGVADGVAAFSRGEATAQAENTYTGVIETSGAGAKGVWASAYGGSGSAVARNRGRITTEGDAYRVDPTGVASNDWRSATGLAAFSRYSDATATNEIGGMVETDGEAAYGMYAWSGGAGLATAVNRGRITTRGGSVDNLRGDGATIGSRGVYAYSDYSGARAGNDATGRVDTHGKRAFGVFAESEADGSRTSGTVEVVNRGQVHTRGWNADGVVAVALHPGTADNPNHVRAISTAGASVTTEGSGASGLVAGVFVPAWTTGDPLADDVVCTTAVPVVCPTVAPAASTAIARNDGTVVTGVVEMSTTVDAGTDTGDDVSMDAGTYASNGVVASFFSSTGTTISSAGDVTVINTGDVTVKRKNATGLYAETFGSGTATVRMLGGSVSAEGDNGRGLWARTGTTGTVDATIAGGAEIAAASTAGIAAKFDGGTTNVRLLDSVLDGKVEFGTGADTFTVRDSRVTGAIDFGTGSDTLSAHGDSWLEGGVGNLETLTKRGTGNLVMGGDASFSSGASAEVENGGLVFTGQFDLGATGTMRIHDAARLTAAFVDADAPPQITAGGGITFDGDAELFVQVSPDITDANETTYLDAFATTGTSGTNPIANGTSVTGPTGTTRVALRTARGPSTVGEVGHIPLVNGATNTARTVVTSGVSLGVFAPGAPEDLTDLSVSPEPPEPLEATGTSTAGPGGSGLSFGGGVGALGSALSGLFDDEMFAFALDGGQDGEVLPAAGFLGMHRRDGDVEYWARSWSDDSPVLAGGAEARVRGADMGAELPMGTSFRFGVSLAPEVSVSSAMSGAGTRLDGTRYAVRGGWRGERLHAGASVSQGRYRAHSVLDNPVAGGGLSSTFGLVQDHVQVGAGARMTWSGVRVAPSVSLLSGALRQDAHTAEGAAFRAEVPAFSQRYQGWKSELRVSPAQWLRGPKSLRWRPALHLYSQRTHSTVPESLDVAQHDRAGVLSLSSAAEVSGLPRTVHGFNATVDALSSKAWRMQLGLAGMESDGDYSQTVYARVHIRF